MMVFGCGAAHAATCPIASGTPWSSVLSTVSACASGNLVTFAAGTYTATSTLNVPSGVSLAGPTVPLLPYTNPDGYIHLGYTPTATIQGNLGRTCLVTLAPSTATESIEYMGFNGETPSALGGCSIYVPANQQNLTITRNYLYGNQTGGASGTGSPYDSLIFMDGSNPGTNAQNITITWNRGGASGNCSNIMGVTGSPYQGGNPSSAGGYCAAVGIHTGVTDLVIGNNVIYYQEQGMKDFQGTNNNTSFCNSCTIQYNDFGTIHRIAFESQINPISGDEYFNYNSYHDDYLASYYSMALSLANGTAYPTHGVGNLYIGNQASSWLAIAHEMFGYNSSAVNEMFQGVWSVAISANYSGTFTVTNNTFCGPGSIGQGSSATMNYVPLTNGASNNITFSGNTPGAANSINTNGTSTCSVTASTAPTIYPPAGAQSFPLSVTLTNPGTGINSNTSDWYTTDGSTPVPGTGTAQFYTGPFTLTAAATVKTVGMWGAANQPTTYPSGYGFAPSAVVSAAYTGGGTPTAATPVMSPTAQSFTGTLSVSLTDSTPSSTIHYTTNGTTPTTGSPVYSTALSLTATTTVQALAVAAGYLTSGVSSNAYTLNTPTLTGGYLGNVGGINTLTVGAPAIQFTATGTYSDSVARPLPDSFGNTAVWSSSNAGILTVGSTGLVSCAATGTANVQVTSSPTSIPFSIWTMTCGAAPTVATPVFSPPTQTFTGTQAVIITDATAGSTIYYTTNGTTPTTGSPIYTGTFNVTATTTVKAIAAATGYVNSAVGSATYTLTAATISEAYLNVPGSSFLNYVVVGGTVQFACTIQYSDGVQLTSTVVGVLNARGDEISSWTTSASSVGLISTSGLMTAVALGVTHIQAIINGTVPSSQWYEYVSQSASTKTQGTAIQGVTIQ